MRARAPKGHDADIARLARLVGISDSYSDAYGEPIRAPEATRRGLLEALGLPCATPAQLRDSMSRAERMRAGPLPSLVVAPAGEDWTCPFGLPFREGSGPSTWRMAGAGRGGFRRVGGATMSRCRPCRPATTA